MALCRGIVFLPQLFTHAVKLRGLQGSEEKPDIIGMGIDGNRRLVLGLHIQHIAAFVIPGHRHLVEGNTLATLYLLRQVELLSNGQLVLLQAGNLDGLAVKERIGLYQAGGTTGMVELHILVTFLVQILRNDSLNGIFIRGYDLHGLLLVILDEYHGLCLSIGNGSQFAGYGVMIGCHHLRGSIATHGSIVNILTTHNLAQHLNGLVHILLHMFHHLRMLGQLLFPVGYDLLILLREGGRKSLAHHDDSRSQLLNQTLILLGISR